MASLMLAANLLHLNPHTSLPTARINTPFHPTISPPAGFHPLIISRSPSHACHAAPFQSAAFFVPASQSDGSGPGLGIGVVSNPSANTFFNLIVTICKVIFRLPFTIWNLFRKEESIIAEVEEDVDKAAEVVKEAAKFIEEVAEEVETVSRTLEEDADKVEHLVDKVKMNAKTMHEDIDAAVETLEKSVEDSGRSVSKVTSGRVGVKVTAKEEVKDATTAAGNSSPSNSAFTSNSLAGEGDFWYPWKDPFGMWQVHNFLEPGKGWIIIKGLLLVSILVIFQFHTSPGLRNQQKLRGPFLPVLMQT